LGENGTPPYRVRFQDGHEAVMSPGPDCVVKHPPPPPPRAHTPHPPPPPRRGCRPPPRGR
ncbi:DUF1918 domain-containing protein, partial [Streptomyces sp. NPDC054949]